jgi:hypothetical protein
VTVKTLKELGLLGVLAAVLGVVLYVNYFADSGGPATGTPSPSKSSARTARPTTGGGAVTEVKLELLSAERDPYTPPRRDLFRFKPKPTPVVRVAPAPPPSQVQTPQPTVQRGPQIETLIRYVGYVMRESGPLATLSVRSDPTARESSPWTGQEGGIIEGRYRLQRIEPNAVEVEEIGGSRRRARIPRSSQ